MLHPQWTEILTNIANNKQIILPQGKQYVNSYLHYF